MDIGARIRQLRREQKMTLQGMEAATGINNGNLSKIETGKQGLTHDTMVRIAAALGVPLAKLFDETKSNETAIIRPLSTVPTRTTPATAYASIAELPPGEIVVISGFQAVSTAGRTPTWRVDPDVSNEVRSDEIRHLTCSPSALVTTVVPDRSMAPRLFPGDVLVIDTSANTVDTDGGVYTLIYEGDVVTRRAFKRPGGGLVLHSDNPNVPTITLTSVDMEYVCIVGRVRHRSGPGDL